MRSLKIGQCVNHSMFGVGIVKYSDSERTTLDFYDHGEKLFVTDLLQVEVLPNAPQRPKKSKTASRSQPASGSKTSK